MDERNAAEILGEAREAVLATARSGSAPELAEALAEVTLHLPEQGFAELLAALSLERPRLQRLDEAGGIAHCVDRLHAALNVPPGMTVERLLETACTEAQFDGAALREAAAVLSASDKVTDQGRGALIAAFLAAPADRSARFSAYLSAYITEEGLVRKTLITKELAQAHPVVAAALQAEAERISAVLAARGACALLRATAALVRLADALLQQYERYKTLHARLDYDDLILKSRDLLNRPGVASWVLFKLDGGLDHILVDEAQDTNPEQWRIVAALAEEFFSGRGARDGERTIFAVGDTKQSIYSFQRADPEEFRRMRAHFRDRVTAASEHPGEWPWQDVALDTRSTPSSPSPRPMTVSPSMAPPSITRRSGEARPDGSSYGPPSKPTRPTRRHRGRLRSPNIACATRRRASPRRSRRRSAIGSTPASASTRATARSRRATSWCWCVGAAPSSPRWCAR